MAGRSVSEQQLALALYQFDLTQKAHPQQHRVIRTHRRQDRGTDIFECDRAYAHLVEHRLPHRNRPIRCLTYRAATALQSQVVGQAFGQRHIGRTGIDQEGDRVPVDEPVRHIVALRIPLEHDFTAAIPAHLDHRLAVGVETRLQYVLEQQCQQDQAADPCGDQHHSAGALCSVLFWPWFHLPCNFAMALLNDIGTRSIDEVQTSPRDTVLMTATRTLIYVHDPMCSWCWGFRPTFERLCDALSGEATVVRLLGGLAADSDQPMPAELQATLQDTWRRIQQRIPGTGFNFDFWRDAKPRRSTWPACRAVIAARRLDGDAEEPMIDAIQRAYYLQARNPSDDGTLIALASQLGLDGDRFAHLLNARETHAVLAAEIAQARQMGANSFPSLRLRLGDSIWPVPVDYTDFEPMRDTVLGLFAV